MLNILSVAYPLAPVSDATPGGSEQVLSILDRALTEAGHRSIVVGREEFGLARHAVRRPTGTAPSPRRSRRRRKPSTGERSRQRSTAGRSTWSTSTGSTSHTYLPPPDVPVLITLHCPLEWYDEATLHPGRPGTYFHCVSASQRRTMPPDLDLLPDIPNGVDVDGLRARHAKRRFALALGRIAPEKTFELALDAAKLADFPLVLAGYVCPYEYHEYYFRWDIAPRLDAKRRFIGPIGFARKRRLLTAARCLLVSSQVAETGSLVAMEALACGTPVVAFPNGAARRRRRARAHRFPRPRRARDGRRDRGGGVHRPRSLSRGRTSTVLRGGDGPVVPGALPAAGSPLRAGGGGPADCLKDQASPSTTCRRRTG